MHSSAVDFVSKPPQLPHVSSSSLPEWQYCSLPGLPVFPMPSVQCARPIVDEILRLQPRAPIGPLATELTSSVRSWYTDVFTFFRGASVQVTGALRRDLPLWRQHLSVVDPQLRDVTMARVVHGYKLPWVNNTAPARPIRVWHNSSDLHLQRDAVWRTLKELLAENSVRPWNLVKYGEPKGMSPMKWVTKSGTLKVRIVFVWCAINRRFRVADGKCELDSLPKVRHMWRRYDWQLSADEHNSFHHVSIHKKHLTWCGFSLHPDELPPGVTQRLIAKRRSKITRWNVSSTFDFLKAAKKRCTANSCWNLCM